MPALFQMYGCVDGELRVRWEREFPAGESERQPQECEHWTEEHEQQLKECKQNSREREHHFADQTMVLP